jgi:CheY-like chemotaxis protein
MMPKKDGFAVMDEIRSRKDWGDMAVIIVTAKTLSKKEKDFLRSRTNLIVEKSGVHVENVMEILLERIKEKSANGKNFAG